MVDLNIVSMEFLVVWLGATVTQDTISILIPRYVNLSKHGYVLNPNNNIKILLLVTNKYNFLVK